jgi:cysteine synthase
MALTIETILKDPVVQALNPKGKRFLEARWLSPKLNPGAAYGLDVAALVVRLFPHIKAPATFQMMLEDFEAGRYRGMHTIVVPSSGNTAHAVARLAPAFGFTDVKVVLASDVPESKKGILAALSSVYLIEVPKGKSTADEAEKIAQAPGHYLLDQYGHAGNVRAHELYTGPESLRACDFNLDIVAIGMGSGGTVTGVSRYLKQQLPGSFVIGVRPVSGERVPGNRDKAQMDAVVTLPYQEAVDVVMEGSRKDSFIMMRRLWTEVEPQPGPSSALPLVGLKNWLSTLPASKLKQLEGKRAAFICPDDGRFYSERTTGELDPDQGLS